MNKPPHPPGRRPPASAYPPVLPEERELILQALAQLEGKMLGHIGELTEAQSEHARRLLELERIAVEYRGMTNEVRSVAQDVRQILHRDVSQEQRLAQLEVAREAGKEAGKEAAKKPSAANAAIALLISAAVAGVIQGVAQIIESKQRRDATEPPALEQRQKP